MEINDKFSLLRVPFVNEAGASMKTLYNLELEEMIEIIFRWLIYKKRNNHNGRSELRLISLRATHYSERIKTGALEDARKKDSFLFRIYIVWFDSHH